MIHGVATIEDKRELSSQLAFLYLEKADISDMSPSDFARKYFEVKKEIYSVVEAKSHL